MTGNTEAMANAVAEGVGGGARHGARNVIAHGYVKVKNEIIWEIVEEDIPLLKQEIGAKARLL